MIDDDKLIKPNFRPDKRRKFLDDDSPEARRMLEEARLTMSPEQFEFFQLSRRRPLTLDERAEYARRMKARAKAEREGALRPVGEVAARILFTKGPGRRVPADVGLPFPGHRTLAEVRN